MTQLPMPPDGFNPEWAAQNNRVIEDRLRRLSTLEQRFSVLSETVAGDLTVIASLTGTGYIKRTGDDAWSISATIPNADVAGLGTFATQNFATPPAIGGTTPNSGAFTTVSATGNASFGGDVVATISGNDFQIRQNTANGADSKSIFIAGGGSASAARGAIIAAYGNEYASTGGYIDLNAGDASGARVRLQVNGANVAVVASTGVAFTGTQTCTGNAGVGTASPETEPRLHVQKGSAGTDPTWAGADVLLVENDSGQNTSINLFCANNRSGSIGFSDTDARNAASFSYNHSTTSFLFFSEGAQRASISTTVFAVSGAFSCTGNATLGDASTDTVEVSGRIYGLGMHNNAGGLTGTAQQWIGSATYTPTGTGVSNVSSITPAKAQLMRVGRVVTISGTVDVAPTSATTTTTFRLSLGIVSTLAVLSDLAGAGAFIAVSAHGPVVIYANTATGEAFFSFTSASTNTHSITYTYTYEVL